MDETGILSGLRDIRLPPAPADDSGGWPVLLLVALVCLLALYAAIRFWRRRNAWRFEAARLIGEIDTKDPATSLAEMAAVLRRVATLRGKTDVSRLSGASWLNHLDQLFGRSYFAHGPGQVFGDALYRRPPDGLDTSRLGKDIAAMLRRGALWPW